MPERLSYDEAMLFSATRLKIQDPELKQGQVEKVTLQTTKGAMERPWGVEGGFAVVYKFRTASGAHRALRCFRVPMSPDMQYRYERIGPYFHAHAADITIGFKYYDQGIMVKEPGPGKNLHKVYPVIEMDWIEGVTLVEKVDELCKKRDRAALKSLREQWLEVVRKMRKANMAHGDLAGQNVMIRNDGRMILIDYDGVYIPEFANLPQVLIGQVDYQHPQMSQRAFNEYMDDFSALVIYTTLLVLSIRPELWIKYVKRPAGKPLDMNLLFVQQDFKEPQTSALMRELEKFPDQHVRSIVSELKRQCLQAVEHVRFPFALVDPNYGAKQSLKDLEEAIAAEDDERIVLLWRPELEQHKPAQQYQQRVQLAQQRMKALATFRKALQENNIRQIVASYDEILDGCPSVTQDERDLLALARRFVQAYQEGNDDTLVVVMEKLQTTNASVTTKLTPQEQQRIVRARRRRYALHQLQDALSKGDVEYIAASCVLAKDYLATLNEEELQLADLACSFVEAYQSDDDSAIIAAYDAIDNFGYSNLLNLTEQHVRRVTLAQQRTAAIARLHIAQASRDPLRIAAAYQPVLDASKTLTPQAREQITAALKFAQVYAGNDDRALVDSYDDIQRSTHQSYFVFTTEELRRVEGARERVAVLEVFRRALSSKRPAEIVKAYDSILDASMNVKAEERDQLELARRFVRGYNTDDDRLLIEIADEQQMRPLFIFTAQEQQRLELAKRREQALETLKRALQESYSDAERLLAGYDAALLDNSKLLSQEQRDRVDAAKRYLKMYRETKAALQANNDDAIQQSYDKQLSDEFPGLTQAERERIAAAMTAAQEKQKVKELVTSGEYERAIRAAKAIIARTRREISGDELKFYLSRATARFIRQHDLTDLAVEIVEDAATGNNYAVATWSWPANDLVKEGLLVWRTDTWPGRPGQERNWRDPDWHAEHLHRMNESSTGKKVFAIGRATHIYVCVFSCIRDDWDWNAQQEVWRYGDGLEAGSRCEAGSQRIIWRSYG